MVDVEGEADGDAASRRLDQRPGDELCRRLLQVEVVERQIEAAPRVREERGDLLRDGDRGLAPVRERRDGEVRRSRERARRR